MSVTLSQIDPLNKLELEDRDYLRIGAAVQQLFWINGEIPSVELIYEFIQGMYDKEKIQEYIDTAEFQQKLVTLGIKTDAPVYGALTPEQIVVANMEMSVLDRRSIRQKLEELNKMLEAKAQATGEKASSISLSQYEAWRRDPAYQNYIASRAKALFGTLETAAYKNLAKAIEGGDMNATKMLLEMTGRYQKNINLNINIEAVMVKMIEIVAKHIDDPEVIEAIASEMEELEV